VSLLRCGSGLGRTEAVIIFCPTMGMDTPTALPRGCGGGSVTLSSATLLRFAMGSTVDPAATEAKQDGA
jgi:hypothetical protein